MIKRYSVDYRGDFYFDPNGGEWVKWKDLEDLQKSYQTLVDALHDRPDYQNRNL